MSTTTAAPTYTPADLLSMPDRDRYELVDGALRERNVSKLSSLVVMFLGSLLQDFCNRGQLAWIFGPDCGYQCFPGHPNKVRKPDVSVILRERLTLDQLDEEGWTEIAPDIAVEVVSPNDTAYEVERKVQEYLAAGVRLVWVVYPPTKTLRVHRLDGSEQTFRESDELIGETVLPGFACRVGDLFPTA